MLTTIFRRKVEIQSTVHRLAEIIEAETENYMKMDPDPFDERHPSRADPDCALGHILKVLFRKDSFMNKVTVNFLFKHVLKSIV